MTGNMEAPLAFDHHRILAEIAFQFDAIGHLRQIVEPNPQRPRSLIPFGSNAIGIAPGIGRVIKAAGINQ
jgi:hypothetical protein